MRGNRGAALRRYLSFEDRPGENPWLDLLRCAAIGLVLARHGHRAWVEARGHPLQWSDHLLLNGWMGVDLFFVLSGYLIAGILMRRERENPARYLAAYAWRRLLRIAPAYYAVLLALVCVPLPWYPLALENLTWRTAYHVLMLQDYLPADINVVFWSIGVEMKFYLLAPFVMLAIGRARSPGLLLTLFATLVLTSTAIRWGTALHRGIPADYGTYWPVFRQPLHAVGEPLVLGMAVAVLETRGILRPGPRSAGWMLAGALAILAVFGASHDLMARITLFDVVAQPLLVALLLALAVAAAAALAPVRLPGRIVARVGARLSYTLYLTHFPLLAPSSAFADRLGGTAGAFWTIFLGLSLASALAVHYVCEKPFLAARRALGASPPAGPVAAGRRHPRARVRRRRIDADA